MKKINIKILLILTLSILFIMLPVYVHAVGSFSITGSASLTTGDAKTITVSATGCAGQFSISSSNSSVVTVSPSSVWLDNSSSSITITAKGAGTATIKITATDVTDTELNDVTGSKSCTVTVTAPKPAEPETPTQPTTPSDNNTTKPSNNNTTTKPSGNTTKPAEAKKSDNSNLSSIQIAEGVISPEFSKTVKEYIVNVPYEVTKLSIAATPEHSKGTVTINGNDELKVGENLIEIIVTAEDSSTDKYTIKAIRAKQELSLKTLSIYYVNGNGEKVELKLDPQFSFDVYSYSVNDILAHTIQSLSVEAKANAENAKVEIVGNDELKSGTNEITIKISVTDEAGLKEQKTYTIKVQKEEEPVVVELTTIQKIQNFFGGFGSGITKWISSNFDKIITGMLLISTSAFVGLTIYFAFDYKNYQKLLAKLASYNKENLMERANVALKPENSTVEEVQNIEEKEDKKAKLEEFIKNNEQEEKAKIKTARGKRFK